MSLTPTSTRSRLRLALTAVCLFLGLTSTLAAPVVAQENTRQQERFMDMMSKYLDFSARYVRIAEHPHAVLHLAVESIAEMYQKQGEGAKAIPHLRGLLADTNHRVARNILRMKIRDLLVEYGREDQALDELDALFRENDRVPERPEKKG